MNIITGLTLLHMQQMNSAILPTRGLPPSLPTCHTRPQIPHRKPRCRRMYKDEDCCSWPCGGSESGGEAEAGHWFVVLIHHLV